jgi:chemotaxis protein methyltransferase CheR
LNAQRVITEIPDAQFEALVGLIEDHFGIHIPPQKRVMLIGRLNRMLREYNYRSFEDFYRERLADPSADMLSELADNVSINHTYFWREPAHFKFFREEVLPERIKASKRAKDLRVWCAASSTGEEPYTIAMIQQEALGASYDRWQAGLLATDLSQSALDVAKAGWYSDENAARLPEKLRQRYMQRAGGGWQVTPQLRQEVTFRRFNLTNPTYPFRRPFDSIFCRNVLIYFRKETKHTVVSHLAQHTAPGGYVFIGHAETLGRKLSSFDFVSPGIYRRKP